jgi:hypothetical protein
MTERVRLEGVMEFETASGQVFRIQSVQGGRGVAVFPVLPKGARPRKPRRGGAGRPPSPSTVKLREKLAEDAASGGVEKPAVYVEWLLSAEKGIKPGTAKQRVYKERTDFLATHPGAKAKKAPKAAKKAAPKKGGKRGRKPSPALQKLRAKLEKDAAAGNLKDPKKYIDWVLKQDKDLGLKSARTMVYRERNAVA